MGQQILPFADRMLLVDDMQEDAELLAELLEPLGASIVVVQSAEAALKILDKQIVDLVVTDLNMPGANGLDLAREPNAARRPGSDFHDRKPTRRR
jgi:CheY-like chemotaxis protein